MGAGSVGQAAFALLPTTEALNVLPDSPRSEREMETRAEYYTEGGKYRGGKPEYFGEFEVYEGTLFNSDSRSAATTTTTDGIATTADGSGTTDGAQGNKAVRMAWTANNIGSDVNDVGRCSCQSLETNAGYFCDAWTCSQLGAESARCTRQTEDPGSGQF